MVTFDRVWEGAIKFSGAREQSRSTWIALGYSETAMKVDVRLRHTRTKDGERIEWRANGKPFLVFVRDRDAMVMVQSPDIVHKIGTQATAYPPTTATSFPGLGYLAAPAESDLFARPVKPDDRFAWPDPCADRPCETMAIDYGPVLGVRQIVREPDGRWTTWGNGKQEFEWRLSPGRISFREFDPRTGALIVDGVLSARPTPTVPLPAIAWRREVPKGAGFLTMKGADGYGGEYDPATRDIWKAYDRDASIHATLQREATLPYPLIGAGTLILTVVLGFAARRWHRR